METACPNGRKGRCKTKSIRNKWRTKKTPSLPLINLNCGLLKRENIAKSGKDKKNKI